MLQEGLQLPHGAARPEKQLRRQGLTPSAKEERLSSGIPAQLQLGWEKGSCQRRAAAVCSFPSVFTPIPPLPWGDPWVCPSTNPR